MEKQIITMADQELANRIENRHSPKKSDVDNYKALRCIALLCLFVKVFGFEDCHQTGEFLQRK